MINEQVMKAKQMCIDAFDSIENGDSAKCLNGIFAILKEQDYRTDEEKLLDFYCEKLLAGGVDVRESYTKDALMGDVETYKDYNLDKYVDEIKAKSKEFREKFVIAYHKAYNAHPVSYSLSTGGLKIINKRAAEEMFL